MGKGDHAATGICLRVAREAGDWAVLSMGDRLLSEDIVDIFARCQEAIRRFEDDNYEAVSIRSTEEERKAPKVHICIMERRSLRTHCKLQKDAWMASKTIAYSKAYTALGFSSNENAMTSGNVGFLAKNDWPGVQASNSRHGISLARGGLPLYKNGKLVGAIGVAGDVPSVDERIAFNGAGDLNAPTKLYTLGAPGQEVYEDEDAQVDYSEYDLD